MTEREADEVKQAILSGWITTGPRTKRLEGLISDYVGTKKTVCLNSATAAMEMVPVTGVPFTSRVTMALTTPSLMAVTLPGS